MNRIEQIYEEVICPMCYRLNPQHKTMDYGKGCHSCEEREGWCKPDSTIPDDLMLSEEEIRDIRIDVEIHHKSPSHTLAEEQEFIQAGAKAQLAKLQPIIEENKRMKEALNKIGDMVKDEDEIPSKWQQIIACKCWLAKEESKQ